jgi:succinyl-CoA synthetase alpha subunit
LKSRRRKLRTGIIIDERTRAIVQGITGKQGSFHTKLMLDYGTRIVAGVTPGRGGTEVEGVPVYNTVEEAKHNHAPNASIIFVPAMFAVDAAHEALDGGIKTVIIITEHVPIRDSIGIIAHAAEIKASVVGPNTPGVITLGKCKVGIMPVHVFTSGNVGVISRSGTLTYEIAAGLTKRGIGQSTCLGIGGDPVVGLNFIEALELFRTDSQTEAVVVIGEIGGNLEELTAEHVAKTDYPKPVVAYVAGRSAPAEKRMGHAGAIIMGRTGSAQSKIEAFENAGVQVAEKPSDVAELIALALKQ